MSVETLARGHLSTPVQSTEIPPLKPLQEVCLAPGVGRYSRLERTGFNLPLEMSRFISNYNQNLKEGKDYLQALILSASELEVNIRTFIVEYIQTRTVLPHINRIEDVDGVVRMVGQNGVPIIFGITSAERDGSTLEASKQVENSLTVGGLQKTTNRVAVINSPLGHSGLISEVGKAINYKDNQTMVFWTNEEGELHGLTIVSDLNRDQSKQLSIDLGIEEDLLEGSTEAEQVANIVKNPALFSYGRSVASPAKYVLEKILAIRGNTDFRLEQEDGTIEKRSVAQTWEDIERFESLLKFKPFWEQCLKNLRKTLLSKGNNLDSPFIQSQIARVIEETILDITVDYLEQNKSPRFNIPKDNAIYFKPVFELRSRDQEVRPPMDKYAMAASFLRTRSGCAGGGGKSGISSLSGVSLGSVVMGLASVFGFGGETGKKGKSCINCGEVNYCTKTCYKCDGMLV